MFDLTNKVVLITGLGQKTPLPAAEEEAAHKASGAWGIGAAIATLFARRGAIVFGGNRSLEAAERTKARIQSESEKHVCDVVVADLTDAASVKNLVDACLAKHGRIDILVNNVGRSEPGCPASMDEAVWDAQVDVNLKSVYLTCHHVLPIMEQQSTGGAIINVASIAGLRYIGKPQVAYNATKAAIIQFTKATAVIYAARGVRLNTVVPGLIYAPYTKELAKRFASEQVAEADYMRMRDEQVPMKKMGDAWDVAHAALFLASDEAGYVTGQEIVVDGGITSSTGRT